MLSHKGVSTDAVLEELYDRSKATKEGIVYTYSSSAAAADSSAQTPNTEVSDKVGDAAESTGEKKDNTMLYVGLGSMLLLGAAGGGGWLYFNKVVEASAVQQPIQQPEQQETAMGQPEQQETA